MKFKTITLGRTINRGNFESTRVEATVEVEDDDSAEQIRASLRELLAYMAQEAK